MDCLFYFMFPFYALLLLQILKVCCGLFIYSAKTCLRGKTPPRLGHLAPASEVAGGLILPFLNWQNMPFKKC
jgi:hypothetical protein